MQRREFVKYGCSSLLTLSLSKRGILEKAQATSDSPIIITDPNPIQALTWNQFSSTDFNGDDIERSHEALWNRDEYLLNKGGIPAVSEFVDTVVVGGGCSGLLAAHFLKGRNPVVLEQGTNFGGNSRGEYFQGQSPYSIGAAYVTKPDSSSLSYQVLDQLGLLPQMRAEGPAESKVFYQNRFFQGFWNGATDPTAHSQFQLINAHFQQILATQYPAIPWSASDSDSNNLSLQDLFALDKLSFWDWLQATFGQIHPHILEYFQLYCWSSFGASIDELSAAQALNFLTAETNEVLALPGGNAAITQALVNSQWQTGGPQTLRAGCIVLDITIEGEGVRVCYEGPDRLLRTIKANWCVVAAPKFVAKRIVSDMSSEQRQACDAIEYRAYVVANVFVDWREHRISQSQFSPCFDLYCLEGEAPPSPSALRPPVRPFTDVCFGSWAAGDPGQLGILTVYKPLPYQGARQFLFSPLSHGKYRHTFESGIRNLLQKLNVEEKNVLGLRLSRWGHALPVAAKGALSQGHLERAARPIAGKIFFANQDNWVNPCFETAVAAAATAANSISTFPHLKI
jgi:hypothetical protein